MLPAAPAAGQPVAGAPAAPEAAPATFFAAVQVRVAEVDVVVADHAGRRVTDLTRNELTLFEDGVPVEISGFLAVTPGSGERASPTDPAVTTGHPTATRQPAAGDGAEMLLAILADGHGVEPAMGLRLLPALRQFLAGDMHPADRVLVVSPTPGGSLRVLLAPSTDRAAAATAVEAALASGSGGPAAGAPRALLLELERALPPPGPGAAPGEVAYGEAEARRLYDDIRLYTEQAHRQTMANAGALEQLVQALAGMPGRKAVLVVGGGITVRPGRALLGAWRNRFAGSGREWSFASPFDAHAEDDELNLALGRITAHANGNRVTLYALGSTAVPERGGSDLRTADVWTTQEAAEAWSDVRQSLQMLVEPTGGRASLDPGSGLLRELRGDFASYYTLTYTPRPAPPGKVRSLRVEVARPGLVVRHRRDLRDRPSREVMIERTRAALLLGWQDNPLGLAVALGPADGGERRGVAQLPVTVTMPLANVVLLPQGAFHEGRLTLYLAAADESGGSSEVSEVALPVRVANEQLVAALGQQLGYRTRLALRPARQRLAVSLRDELGNAAATILVDHQPAASPSAATTRPAEPARRDGSQ